MRKHLVGSLAVAGALAAQAQFAGNVISYAPGSGAAAGFDQPASALGEPSRFTVHQFGGPVDPTNPPFLAEQIVSIGAGGFLTLQFSGPVRNDAGNPYGLDFIVYGNAGFILTDFEAGITSGELFGAAAPGSTRVSVSADNAQYFTLDLSLAPTVDRYFPTDGAGTFGVPVNPAWANATAFAGGDLADIRSAYGGSAGGAGFDIGWARDGGGNPVHLSEIQFVRIDVTGGAVEVDGVAAVPEPSTWALLGAGALLALVRKRRA